MDEVEDVLLDRDSQTAVSKSNGEPITFGHMASGRYLSVVWEHVRGCECFATELVSVVQRLLHY